MAQQPEFSHQAFAEFVVSDLKHAKCRNDQLFAIIQGTVHTTITFLRWKRRIVLRTNPTGQQLAKQEFEFEEALLRSVVRAIPRPAKRGRKKDPATVSKFLRILKLRFEGKNWTQIEKDLRGDFGQAEAGTYKKLFNRHLPIFMDVLRKQLFPSIPKETFLPIALCSLKGRPGRPKSRQNKRR